MREMLPFLNKLRILFLMMLMRGGCSVASGIRLGLFFKKKQETVLEVPPAAGPCAFSVSCSEQSSLLSHREVTLQTERAGERVCV